MTGRAGNHLSGVDRVLRTLAGAAGRDADDLGRFPRPVINALGRAGVLGLTLPIRCGGGGHGLAEAAQVVRQVARVCGSTAAVLQAHFAAVAVLAEHAEPALLREIAAGRHLSTLALAEEGRPFAPVARPREHGGVVDLHARKNWVTAAGEADSYVWSSRAVGPSGASTLWLVPASAPGMCVPARPEGVGLRGSATATITGDPVQVPASAMLGADGGGVEAVLTTVLPWLCALNAALALGLAESVVQRSIECVNGPQPSWARWQEPPPRQPEVRADLARMQTRIDVVRLQLSDAVRATWQEPAEAQRRLLQLRATAGESAVRVAELGMKVCGQFAFRKDFGVERRFRDAHAATYGQFPVDAALDYLGRILCDLPLLG